MKREIIAAIGLLIMALALYSYNLQHEEQIQFSNEQEPDFVAQQLRSRTYNQQGQLTAQISADVMRHYQSQARTELTAPTYLIYPENGRGTWIVSAQQGFLLEGRFATLEQDVTVTVIEPSEPIKTLTTSLIELDLETMEIRSDRAVYAKGIDFTMQAVGLYGNLNTNQVEFLTDIEAVYEFY